MDKRKNNGGNSTKSLGVDKRKNEYKNILEDALSPSEVKTVVTMLFERATSKQDVNAAKILLEYYLGKPTQSIINENINYKEEELTPKKIDEIKNRIENKY